VAQPGAGCRLPPRSRRPLAATAGASGAVSPLASGGALVAGLAAVRGRLAFGSRAPRSRRAWQALAPAAPPARALPALGGLQPRAADAGLSTTSAFSSATRRALAPAAPRAWRGGETKPSPPPLEAACRHAPGPSEESASELALARAKTLSSRRDHGVRPRQISCAQNVACDYEAARRADRRCGSAWRMTACGFERRRARLRSPAAPKLEEQLAQARALVRS